jgi:hypothetical protein
MARLLEGWLGSKKQAASARVNEGSLKIKVGAAPE